MARAKFARRRRGNSVQRRGLAHAAQQIAQAEKIQGARAGIRPRRKRRLDIGRPRHRLYPQAGLAAKQRYGLAPTPIVVGSVLIDDDDTE